MSGELRKVTGPKRTHQLEVLGQPEAKVLCDGVTCTYVQVVDVLDVLLVDGAVAHVWEVVSRQRHNFYLAEAFPKRIHVFLQLFRVTFNDCLFQHAFRLEPVHLLVLSHLVKTETCIEAGLRTGLFESLGERWRVEGLVAVGPLPGESSNFVPQLRRLL